MDEDDLIVRIRELAASSPSYNASPAKSPAMGPISPVTLGSLRHAEQQLGFALPRLLQRLYLEVGNGGFGPGFGLLGISGGFPDDVQGLTLPELYLANREFHWPEKLVPICDWGCTMGSAIDCSSLEGEMVFMGDSSPHFMPEGVPFAPWMEDWTNGVDLFQRAYLRYQKRDRPRLRSPYDF